jgi:hypothetical protein
MLKKPKTPEHWDGFLLNEWVLQLRAEIDRDTDYVFTELAFGTFDETWTTIPGTRMEVARQIGYFAACRDQIHDAVAVLKAMVNGKRNITWMWRRAPLDDGRDAISTLYGLLMQLDMRLHALDPELGPLECKTLSAEEREKLKRRIELASKQSDDRAPIAMDFLSFSMPQHRIRLRARREQIDAMLDALIRSDLLVIEAGFDRDYVSRSFFAASGEGSELPPDVAHRCPMLWVGPAPTAKYFVRQLFEHYSPDTTPNSKINVFTQERLWSAESRRKWSIKAICKAKKYADVEQSIDELLARYLTEQDHGSTHKGE